MCLKETFMQTPRPQPEQTTVDAASAAWTDRQLLDWYIGQYTEQGWQIVSQNDHGVQFRKPRQWSAFGAALFVLLPAVGGCLWRPLLAVAVIGLLVVVADYLLKKEALMYLTADDARRQAKAAWASQQGPASSG
jgi:hypothetical protein